jgi:large repetitive protein
MRNITIESDPHPYPWVLAGIVEGFKNAGVHIPKEIDQAKDEYLIKINVRRYMRDEFPAVRARIVNYLQSLPLPEGIPSHYYKSGSLKYLQDAPPWMRVKSDYFLEDKILGVGLKSYPLIIDWDGNGKKDMLVGDHDGVIYLFRNIGKPGQPEFGRGERVKCPLTGSDFMVCANPKMTLAHFCNDEREYMVFGNYHGVLPIFQNRCKDGGYEFAMPEADFIKTKDGVIDLGNYVYPEVFDWDNDGFPDLLVGTIEGTIYLIRNTGNTEGPIFEDPVPIEGTETLMYPHPTMVDWDGDGLVDMLLGHREGTVLFYKNVGEPGKPKFESRGQVLKENGAPVEVYMLSHQCPVSWRDDGKYDLLVGNDSGQVVWFKNRGSRQNPVFSEGEMLKDGGGELICGVHPVIAMTDWNNNGFSDILVGHQEETLRLFRNNNGSFDDFEELTNIKCSRENHIVDARTEKFWNDEGLYFSREYLGNLSPAMVDWDGGGKNDLLLGNYTGLVYHYRNIGDAKAPVFDKGRPLMFGDQPLRVAGFSTPIAVDWNNDGKMDIVCGDLTGHVHLFLNSGEGRGPLFEKRMMVEVGGEPIQLGPRSIVEVADLNGDGRKDLLIGNRFGMVYALINIGADDRPVFDKVYIPVDETPQLWEKLYGGMRHSPAKGVYLDERPILKVPHPLSLVETSCPRVFDWDGDGENEWVMSQRYGRIFIFKKC